MKTEVPKSLVNTSDVRVVVDAVYYVVRVLRNASRGYRKTEVSTEPSPEARRLAERAIREIRDAEHKKIEALEDDRIGEYITALEAFLMSTSGAKAEARDRDAERILKKMRAQRPA